MENTTVNVAKFEKLRPLGALEQYSSARHQLGFYHNVGISASYRCLFPPSTHLKTLVLSALASVIDKHAIMSAITVNEDSNNPYFARLPSFNLEDAVTFITRQLLVNEGERDIELDSILEEQHNTNFKENYGKLPFWRLIITTAPGVENEFVASYIFHHALGDGTSGVVFHKDFLLGLQTHSAPLTSKIIIPPKRALLPTLEQANQLATASTNCPHIATSPWAGKKIAQPARTNYRSFVLSAPTSAALIRACRAEATTLTATLPILIAVALTNALTPSTSFEELECTIPINLRRFLSSPISDNEMGIWIDAFSQYYRRDNVLEFTWEHTRRSKATITEALKSEGKEVNILNIMGVTDMRQYFLSKVGTERTSSFNVSNLGSMKIPPEEEGQGWKMGRMVFGRTASVVGSAIDVGVITGPDGCIVLGFCWQEGVVSQELVEAVMKGVENGIQSVVGMV